MHMIEVNLPMGIISTLVMIYLPLLKIKSTKMKQMPIRLARESVLQRKTERDRIRKESEVWREHREED